MIDITKLSPVELNRFLHLQSIVDRQSANHERIKALRAYYNGDHPVLLTQRQQEFLGDLVTGGDFVFAHNLVRTIVDTMRERLEVTGFAVNGKSADDLDEENPDPDAQVAALLWHWWTQNRLDSQQIRLYRRAIRDGLSYTIVDFDNERRIPRVNLHKVDDGVSGITLHRDPTDNNRILFANRYFYTYDPLTPGVTGLERKTTYLPGEIRKYIMRQGGWEEILDDGDATWPLPWTNARGEPLGVPVVEFENPGGSEIAQIIGLQNALNKSWLDLIAAADSSGFPILAIEYPDDVPLADVSDDDDIEGDDEFHISPGRALEVAGKMHRIDGANLDPMINTMWAIVTAIAGVSRTPQYYLRPVGGSDVPSGESLKQLESGLVKRAEERQLMFGQAWADVMKMALKVAQTFGDVDSGLDVESLSIAPVWADPNVRNEQVMAAVAEAHRRLGVPDEQVWAILGYDNESIAGFKQIARQERAQEIANIAAALRAQERTNAPQTNPQRF